MWMIDWIIINWSIVSWLIPKSMSLNKNHKKHLFSGKGWLSLPPMQDARHQPGATVVDGKFFVAGGYDPVRLLIRFEYPV